MTSEIYQLLVLSPLVAIVVMLLFMFINKTSHKSHSYLIVTQMQRKSGKVSISNNNILSSKRIKNPDVLGSVLDTIKRDYDNDVDPVEKIIALYIYKYGKERDTND